MEHFLVLLTVLSVMLTITYGLDEQEWNKHHNNEELYQVMVNVNKKCPDITRLYSLPVEAHKDVPDHTASGKYKLWVIEFANQTGKHVKGIPEFKYIANMHGNEVVGRELLLRLIDYMCGIYTGEKEVENGYDPENGFDRMQILWLIKNTRMHFMPSMNPDGWQNAASSVGTGDYQNGVKNWLVGRANNNDVDLNRNFPDLNKIYYRIKNKPFHQNNHLDEHFEMVEKLKGIQPEKGFELEPETKMMMSWLHDIPFVLSSNMHNGDLVANYPFDETVDNRPKKYTKSPDDKTFRYLAESYSMVHHEMANPKEKCDNSEADFKNGITNGAAWYSVPGGLQDYNYLSTNCFEITLELGCDKFPPASQLNKLWKDNINSLFNFIFQVHIGIKGEVLLPYDLPKDTFTAIHIRDEETGQDIDHDILVTKYGDYYRLLSNGRYTVTATVKSEDGKVYLEETKSVTIENDPTGSDSDGPRQALILNFDFRSQYDNSDDDSMSVEVEADPDQRDYYNVNELKDFLRKFLYRNRYPDY